MQTIPNDLNEFQCLMWLSNRNGEDILIDRTAHAETRTVQSLNSLQGHGKIHIRCTGMSDREFAYRITIRKDAFPNAAW